MILFLPAGQERAVPLPEEAAKSAKATHDLLRRFKELGTNMKAHAPPSAIEQDLQVSSLAGGTHPGMPRRLWPLVASHGEIDNGSWRD